MAIIYNITIESAGKDKENLFHITWQKKGTKQKNGFDQKAKDITKEEVERLWQQPKHQFTIGNKLFRFLDGNNGYLQQALEEAIRKGEPLQLNLCPCNQVADWPFELLARGGTFLLPQQVHLVRCVSEYGTEKKMTPQNRPLKLLFMACSALDVEAELDFEKEEEAIFKVTEKLAVDMEVEDTGSLEGLREQLEHQQYNVVHLSGHANIDKEGRPFFIMENETGYQRKVFPYQLWEDALIENPPQLLFLSGCRTGESSETFAEASFARWLVEKRNVLAVLGWGRSVSDEEASHAGKMLYHELNRGRTILEAVQRARHELIKEFPKTTNPAWPLLRLFSSGMVLDAIVKKSQQPRLTPRRMVHTFLKNSQVQVLAEGFVGRRRQLQRSIRALKQEYEKVGLLLLGTGGLGKSCLAGKISERFSKHTLIVVHGKFNAYTLEPALKAALIQAEDEKGKQILAAEKEMSEKLAELCAASFKEKNYLILLDDFEQNIEGAEEGQPGNLLDEAKELLNVLLQYLLFSGKMTQMIITSRYSFSPEEQGRDLVKERLEWITLTSFSESELRKKARELENIFYYADQSLVLQLVAAGHGNPRLMEWLDVLVGQMEAAEVPQLLEAISGKQEEYIRKHVIRELLQRGGDDLTRLLRWLSIYRRPVLIDGVRQVGESAGLGKWKELLQEGIGLSLIEYDQARENYQLTPLLREELLAELKDRQACHQAAFAYYKKVCEGRKSIDPIQVEEWIYHALGCGEEEVASEQGGRLVQYLRKRLAFRESRRVGLWVREEKKRELFTANDAFLLGETALTIKILGDLRKAIAYYDQTLTIWKKVCGENHPNVGTTLNNLGEVFRELGEPKKAIAFYERALAIWKKVYGDMHPQVAIGLNNLGFIYLQQGGQKEKAKVYLEQAYKIKLKFFGPEHPSSKKTAGWLEKCS
jgi:tetratricopeptide (TPR) repeat protein